LKESLKHTRLTGFSWAVFRKIWMWACTRRALERSYGAQAALQCAGSTIAYSYWAGNVALAIPMLASRGAVCVVRYHSADLYLDFPGLEQGGIPWREDVARATTLSLFISKHAHEYFLRTLGDQLTGRSRAVVSRLGSLDYGPGPARQNNDVLTIVSCSFIKFEKRVHLIAELMKEISKRRKVVWHHFGGGSGAAPMPNLTDVDDRRLKVKLWGTVPHETIISFFRNSAIDLFVNLSVYEGVPVSIMEAISFGIPVVATDVGAVREVVMTGRSGLLVSMTETEDLGHLAGRILNALEPEGEIGRSRPRELWDERFNAVQNHARLAKLLIQLLPNS
jgi:colanic acid/amylovoran biosynthesis glycosyltransferase